MNNEKKYQVFISSTYSDLKDERMTVLDAVLRLGHIPAGMELFPANNSSAWEYIQRTIAISDYYVLIIGGRYGSIADDGIGFTEKEYDYAYSLGIPIIALLHSEPTELPRKNTENGEGWEKLKKFREKVDLRHTRTNWNNESDLRSQLLIGLNAQIVAHPRRGWIRDNIGSDLSAISEAGKQNSSFSATEIPPNLDEIHADRFTPKETWKQRDFQFALFNAIVSNNSSLTHTIFDTFLERFTTPKEVIEWKAYREYVWLFTENGGSLNTLKEYAKEAPTSSHIQLHLGRILSNYEEHKIAAQHFELASELTSDTSWKITHLKSAIQSHWKLGDVETCNKLMLQVRLLVSDDNTALTDAIQTVRTLSELKGETDVYFGASEKLLELDPSNHELRFELAYKYAEEGQDNMAVVHYARIPPNDRTAFGWNNLGVSQGRLKLHSMAVNSLRSAEKAGETLANSNLALRFADAGFLDEAHRLCQQALAQEHYSDNIHTTQTRLKDIPAEEEKLRLEIVAKANTCIEFYRGFGGAVARTAIFPSSGVWKGPECTLTLTLNGDTFTAIGEYEVPLNALALTVAANSPKTSTYEIKYKATILGHAAIGTSKRQLKGSQSTWSLLLDNAPNKALFIISDDGLTMNVFETTYQSSPKIHLLHFVS
jgi:tetratricopeptide (TPR) repeat protein